MVLKRFLEMDGQVTWLKYWPGGATKFKLTCVHVSLAVLLTSSGTSEMCQHSRGVA